MESNIPILEMIWTGAAALGLIFSAINLRMAWQEYRALGTLANGRRFIAKNYLLDEVTRWFNQLVWTAIGLYALSVPNSGQLNLFAILLTLPVILTLIDTLYSAYARRMTKPPKRRD